MGKAASLLSKQRVDTPIMCLMRKKHGDECLITLNQWEIYGFPQGGSLSLNQLEQLQDRLKQVRENWCKKNKTVSVKWLKLMELHDKNWKIWHDEAIFRRNKIKEKKKLLHDKNPCPNTSLTCPSPSPSAPPPYSDTIVKEHNTADGFPSVYPKVAVMCSLDADLDSCPSLAPSQNASQLQDNQAAAPLATSTPSQGASGNAQRPATRANTHISAEEHAKLLKCELACPMLPAEQHPTPASTCPPPHTAELQPSYDTGCRTNRNCYGLPSMGRG